MEGLKNKRLALKLSRKDFAKIMGVSQTAINQYERGVREPCFALLKEFATYFNCTIDELL